MSEHEQMIEVHVVWEGDSEGVETDRPICRYCWHEGPDGEKRRADWPCSTVRAREAVALLNSMVLSGESHSDRSREAVRRAMDDDDRHPAPAATPGAGDGEG